MDKFLINQFNNSVDFNLNKIGIYFLFKECTLVYIGQTTRGQQRIFEHKEKDFDRYSFMPCDIDDLNKKEKELILKYRPIYNKDCSVKKYSKKIDDEYCTLMKALGKFGIGVSVFCGEYYGAGKFIKILKKNKIRHKYMNRGNHSKKLCVHKEDVLKFRNLLEEAFN